MARRRTPVAPAPVGRGDDLRRMLIGRRDELQQEVEAGIRVGRSGQPKDGGDTIDDADAATQSDIALSLLKMRAEMLARIDQAIVRLDAGRYGTCFECEEPIAERRLHALPFAVRCQVCEREREQVQGRATHQEQQRGSFWLLSEKTGA